MQKGLVKIDWFEREEYEESGGGREQKKPSSVKYRFPGQLPVKQDLERSQWSSALP
jgi:hypothetical protein